MALTQVQGGMLAGSTNTTTTIQSNGTTAITINSSQQVGIGRVPGTGRTLEIATATDFTNIILQNTSTGSGSTDGFLLEAGGSDALVVNYEVGNMRFFTSATERMRIDSSGRFLFNTSSSLLGSAGAQFVGNSTFSNAVLVQSFNGNNAFVITNQSGTSQYNAAQFCNNGTTFSGTGSISISGSSTAYNTSSDYRLKENIAPMTGALSVVQALKPVTYKWKSDGSDGQGFIAHELQAIVPESVTGEKDAVDADGNPKYQGVDTSFLVATLTAAIQELNAKVEAQAAEIAALKAAP